MPTPAQRIGAANGLLQAQNGSPQFLGVIIATSVSKDNSNTATVFPVSSGITLTVDALKGMLLMVQPDVACYIQPQTVAATAAVASDSAGGAVYLAARERITYQMLPTEGWLSCVVASGATTVNLKVWRLA